MTRSSKNSVSCASPPISVEQGHGHAAFDDNLDHALRGAAQRERIARTGGHHAHAEAAAQGIELVGQRNQPAGGAARDRIFHALRFVMIVDGLPDFVRLALRARVESADDALQFGELLDQFGGEIALGQARRALGVLVAAEFLHQCHHAFGLLQIRPELGLESYVGEIFDAVREFLALIGLPEEARIVEARAQHALVAAADQSFGIGAGVHHGNEPRREMAGFVFHREVLLVVAHHGDEHFFGQCEELRIEFAERWEWGIRSGRPAFRAATGRVSAGRPARRCRLRSSCGVRRRRGSRSCREASVRSSRRSRESTAAPSRRWPGGHVRRMARRRVRTGSSVRPAVPRSSVSAE